MKLLVVLPDEVSDDALAAGHRTEAREIRRRAALADETVVVLVKRGASAGRNVLPPKYVLTISWLDLLLGALADPAIPPRYRTRYGFRVQREFRRIVASERPDHVYLAFPQTLALASAFHGQAKPRIAYSAVDILSQKVLRGGWYERLAFSWYYRFEREYFSRVDEVVVQSGKDVAILKGLHLLGDERTIRIEPVTMARPSSRRAGTRRGATNLVFWGAMARPENHRAASWFATRQFPRVLERFPDAKLFVVGAKPPRSLTRLASANVIVTGFVENPFDYFDQCSIGIAPLIEGAGIKVKVLEMLGAGLHVIASPVGAEGIEPHPELEVCEVGDTAERLIRYLSRPNSERAPPAGTPQPSEDASRSAAG